MLIGQAEYIWIDGSVPTSQIRSKTKIGKFGSNPSLNNFPDWNFDGSSTNQAIGNDSDCLLKPVNFIKDPIRGENNYIVLCEVFNSNEMPHSSNSRAKLRKILDAGASKLDAWIGFEQEYTLFKNAIPLGWPKNGSPAPQGPYYCGVGSNQIFGRELIEEHTKACIDADIMIYGANAEVMPGQWEFQIGYRGISGEKSDPLTISDHLWIARFLLHRISENYNIHVSFDNKPVKGDWNGAGMHTNFSTRETRDKVNGKNAIKQAIDLLSKKHSQHIELYGHALGERLTGEHETCSINDFKYGVADRGSSIRIPRSVNTKNCGYFEDRRPGANADPYLVSARLCTTIAEIDEL